jgi:DNA primase
MLDLKLVKEIIFSDIDRLLDSFGLEYRLDGDNIFMACPVHAGSDNEHGVSISLSRQSWTCWTRGCHEEYNRDIFGFVKGILGDDNFGNCLKYICKLYNVDGARQEGGYQKPVESVEQDFGKLVRSFKALDETFSDYEFNFPPVLDGSPYFESRGFKPETLAHFGVKDCNDKQHAMRHRSIIPVNYDGKQIGFIARSTQEWLKPKYLFSTGLKKTDYFYNYDNAIGCAKATGCLFLVEGQGDVWRLCEAGCHNVVGLFGKSISARQRAILMRSGITTLVILTDNDQPGRESKMKIKREFGRFFNLIFPEMKTKDLGNTSPEKLKTGILKDLKGHYHGNTT